jgi:hypothetical protein
LRGGCDAEADGVRVPYWLPASESPTGYRRQSPLPATGVISPLQSSMLASPSAAIPLVLEVFCRWPGCVAEADARQSVVAATGVVFPSGLRCWRPRVCEGKSGKGRFLVAKTHQTLCKLCASKLSCTARPREATSAASQRWLLRFKEILVFSGLYRSPQGGF